MPGRCKRFFPRKSSRPSVGPTQSSGHLGTGVLFRGINGRRPEADCSRPWVELYHHICTVPSYHGQGHLYLHLFSYSRLRMCCVTACQVFPVFHHLPYGIGLHQLGWPYRIALNRSEECICAGMSAGPLRVFFRFISRLPGWIYRNIVFVIDISVISLRSEILCRSAVCVLNSSLIIQGCW